MKSTLAVNKQLFNVKAVAAAGLLPEAMLDDTLGIIDMVDGSATYGQTVVPATFTALPAEFRIISKFEGKLYYSFDNIIKENIIRKANQDYQAEIGEIWESTIDCCSCIEDMVLNMNLLSSELIQQDGLTWTHRDTHFAVSTEEMKCHCSCDGTAPVLDNNIMTQLLVNKVNEEDGLYTAYAGYKPGTAIPTTDPAVGDGDIYFSTNDLVITIGGSPVIVGEKVDANSAKITDMEAFIEAFREANTAGIPANFGPKMTIVIEGKVSANNFYRDLEESYIYPRGTKMNPSLGSSKGCRNPFVKLRDLQYELGAGYDLRAEEFDSMTYYTNIVHFQGSRGIASKDLIYQFKNGTNYNVVNFEFTTDKTEKNNGDKRLFGVLLGTDVAGVYTSLKNMLGL